MTSASGQFETILAAAKSGDEWAITALYRELHPSVLRYLRAQAPKDGDDLASQVWVDAAAALVRFTGDESDAGGSPPIGLRNHLRPTT